mgnify:CR=1 FL=1|tara:strand:- start:2907 stop:4316 length:1410 start_codon:yes stop_codon:yes gene_type:complete
MLNKTTNLYLKVIAKTKNNTTYSITGIAVPQKFKTKDVANNFGNTTVTDGYITINNTTSTSLSRAGAGTINEVTTYSLSSIMPFNKALKIALVALSPSTGYSLLKKPKPVLRKRINGLKVFLEETSTANVYNLMCKTDRAIRKSEDVTIDLDFLIYKPTTVLSGDVIKKVSVGALNIPTYGCKKEIKIYGTPNTPFELSILDSNDKNIISSANSTAVLPSGVTDVMSSTLNRRGYYKHFQKFPATPAILATAVNVGGGATNVSQVTFDSLSGVLVGDEIIFSDTREHRANNGEVIKVLSIDSTYVCTLSKRVTLADNKKVLFRRAVSYKVNVETTGTKDSNINSVYPTHTITQNLGAVITFNATTSVGAITINGGAGGATYTRGYGNKSKNIGGTRKIRLVYTLGGKTLTEVSNHPVISDFVKASGDSSVNGVVTSSGSGTTSYKIIADLDLSFVNDTIFNINVDNIVT